MGKLGEAELQLRRALSSTEGTLGDRHPRLAGSLLELGQLSMLQTRFDEARTAIDRAATIIAKSLGADSVMLIAPLRALADYHLARLEYADAAA